MSAYFVVEATVRGQAARDRYGSRASAMVKQLSAEVAQFGAEVVTFGQWQLISGEPSHDTGMILRFPDKAAALAWYNSPAYQALLEIRADVLDCRFRLVG